MTRLRDYLNRLAMDQAEREEREAMEGSIIDGDGSAGGDTISEDGTIGEDGSEETVIGRGTHIVPVVNVPTVAGPVHVEMPLFPPDLMIRMGPVTPLGSLTPQRVPSPALASFIGPGSMYDNDADYVYNPQIPGFDDGDGDDERDASKTREGHTRRHTLESGMDFYGTSGTNSGSSSGVSSRAFNGDRRRSLFGLHGMLMPTLGHSGSARGSWRSREPSRDYEDPRTFSGLAGNLMSSFHVGGSGQQNARPANAQGIQMYGGPHTPPATNGSDHGEGLRRADDERRAILRAMLEAEMAQQQMEEVDTHRFVQESEGGGGAVPGRENNDMME